jgi:glutamate-5-semialdehyde dehydrogenase
MDLKGTAGRARGAAIRLATAGGEAKNRALNQIACALRDHSDEVTAANRRDLERAAGAGLEAPLVKRLRFDAVKIEEAIQGIESLIGLDDPVGRTITATELDRGLELYQVSCPIGVIGVVFESRPDALVQISSLALKSGNAVLLKGGAEAAETNRILARIIGDATSNAGIPDGWLALLETRGDVRDMLELDDHIDLIIPRGSNAFVRHIMDNTTIPVLGHAEGICHVYVDRAADLEMAIKLVVDSKAQYVAACNAAETVLVHEAVAMEILPDLRAALTDRGVEIRGCEATEAIIDVVPAEDADWRTEYLDLIVSIRVVDGLDPAIDHINSHGSGHTDVIVTADPARAAAFMDGVDSAGVFVNCSSRFADGFRFGLGAEVGIGTGKIHARGPVGLDGLTIYKWRLLGHGQVVADYLGDRSRGFTHRRLDKKFGV